MSRKERSRCMDSLSRRVLLRWDIVAEVKMGRDELLAFRLACVFSVMDGGGCVVCKRLPPGVFAARKETRPGGEIVWEKRTGSSYSRLLKPTTLYVGHARTLSSLAPRHESLYGAALSPAG